MGTEAKRVQLFDFIYRDPARVASYYAQLFGGHLSTIETGATSRNVADNVYGGSAWVVKGERKTTTEGTETYKEVAVPHDVIACTLLAKLAAEGRINDNSGAAKAGELVKARGTLCLLDGTGLQLAMAGLTSLTDALTAAGTTEPKEQLAAKVGFAALQKMQMPSVFYLDAAPTMFFGTIKDAGLDESVIAFNFKHGSNGSPDVTVIGVREHSRPFTAPGGAVLFEASRRLGDALANFIAPVGATMLTPLVIYREST